MIIVSNHVKNELKLPEDVVIRINVAWVKTLEELEALIEENSMHPIYLDYPEGRTKPPKPTVSLHETIRLTHKYDHIKYFAVSNAGQSKSLKLIQESIHKRCIMVPKIETPRGVLHVTEICDDCRTHHIMLDKEDLYSSVGGHTAIYENYIAMLRARCAHRSIIILELQGVVFYESK